MKRRDRWRDAGLPGTDTRASRVFKLLRAACFLYKERNYYQLHPAVQEEGTREEEGEKHTSTVSLPGHFGDPQGDEVFVMELRVLECHRRFVQRLRQLVFD
jgi:hypothetical protein